MSSTAEDFPTPISPIRRMVYGTSVSFFDVLMIPCLRPSTLLETRSVLMHQTGRCKLLDNINADVTLIIVFQHVLARASKMIGSDLVTARDRRSVSVVVHGHGQEKTHNLGAI